MAGTIVSSATGRSGTFTLLRRRKSRAWQTRFGKPLRAIAARVSGFPGPSISEQMRAEIVAAGYRGRTAQLNGVTLNYVEGPDNGPPLVLLHAQYLDWFSYGRVLPALSRNFRVYAIDYPGHGRTRVPDGYAMSAARIGTDLGNFIAREIGQPVFVAGNSSGGLLAAWLAANRPRWIRAALLEDPPLFASEYPRIRQTVAYAVFGTSHTAAHRDHPDDFLLYWIEKNAKLFRRTIGAATAVLLLWVIRAWRTSHPRQPIETRLVRNHTARMLLHGLGQYDPRFGAAFYDGSWNRDFDHAEALKRIACPVLLIQARTGFLPDGRLKGAMSSEDASQARSLLRDGRHLSVDAGHVVHLDKPGLYLDALQRFFAEA